VKGEIWILIVPRINSLNALPVSQKYFRPLPEDRNQSIAG
jgi:hypothetical protein